MPDSIQRLRYHTGLFLEEQEFQLEQRYYMALRRRVNFGLFESGILIGLDLQYDGTTASVTPGVCLVRDVATQEGRELLVDVATTVPLTGFSAGDAVVIILSYLEEARAADIKTPTNTPARVTEVARIEAVLASALVPDPDVRVPLGQITIGTALAGAAPGRRQALIRSQLLPTPATPGIVLNPSSVTAGQASVPMTIIGTGGFDLTGVVQGDVTIGGGITIASFANPGAVPGTIDLTLNTTAAVAGAVTVSVDNGTSAPTAPLTVAAGFALANFVGINEPAGNTNSVVNGSGFASPLTVEFTSGVGTFTAPVSIPSGNVNANTITIPRASIPPTAIVGPIRVTIPGNPPLLSSFAFTPPPEITGLATTSAGLGNPVTINGRQFVTGTIVLFDPYTAAASRGPASVPPFPDGTIGETLAPGGPAVALVPNGARLGPPAAPIRIQTAGGIAQSTQTFERTA